MSSATGTSAIVSILDEHREQLRNEGLFLLVRLVKGHSEIQKRVAFENAFEKVFVIIDEEGGLEGGVVASDCFTLLHNLLADNVSNQNWFRETQFFKNISKLFANVDKAVESSISVTKNIVALMRITRLFVKPQSKMKATNQDSFMTSGLVTQMIGFAFSISAPQDVRAEALLVLADLIHNNPPLQEYFLKASAMASNPMNSTDIQASNDVSALLRILLYGEETAFDMRYSASLCLESVAVGNEVRKLGILQKIIDDYFAGKDGNMLQGLLEPSSLDDQFKTWFAACTLLHLTHEDQDARQAMTDVMIGNAEDGEVEVSIIQTISANLVSALHRKKERAAAAYLMLLGSWLFDSRENVADFLEESSTLQALIASLQSEESSTCTRGLCATLLSICYAFDFADATAVSRSDMHNMFLRLGRDVVVGSIVAFSHHEELRQTQPLVTTYEKPLLDVVYVDFFRDNYGLIRKAVDLPPNPPRTRREAEAQEEAERTEDIISDLESELERKSSGLDEAILIIKTRQEELQRLRDEVKYINQKHLVESAQSQRELEKSREENEQLKAAAVESSNEIDKALRDQSHVHADLEKALAQLEVTKKDLALSTSKVDNFEREVRSEASKRAFLEKELASVRELSGISSQQLEQGRVNLVETERQLSEAREESETARARIAQLQKDLTATREELKKVEVDLLSWRTKAHDASTELAGLRQDMESRTKSSDRELVKVQEEKLALEQEMTKTRQDHVKSSAELHKLEVSHAAEIADLETKLATESEQNKVALARTETDVVEARDRVKALETQLEKSKQIAANALKTAKALKSAPEQLDGDLEKALRAQVADLTAEKADLQRQLDQAQEDLMLLMEDEGETTEA